MEISIFEFCYQYAACAEGRKWAVVNCKTMKDVWDKAPLEYLIWVARRSLTLKQLNELFKLLNEHYFYYNEADKVSQLNFQSWCSEQTNRFTDQEIVATISMYIRSFTPNFTREFHVR